jgi:hypothetical protein
MQSEFYPDDLKFGEENAGTVAESIVDLILETCTQVIEWDVVYALSCKLRIL